MKRNKKCLLVLSVFAMLLTGCGNNSSSSGNNSSTSSESNGNSQATISNTIPSNLPTEIPVLNEDSIQIHYQRKDGYNSWALWLWSKGKDGNQYDFNYQDDFGVVASYPLSAFEIDVENNDQLGFIIKKGANGEWLGKDTENDRFIDFSMLKKDENGVYSVYIFQDDSNIYLNEKKEQLAVIKAARFTSEKSAYFEASVPFTHVEIYKDNQMISSSDYDNKKNVVYNLEDFLIDYESNYIVKITTSNGIVLSNEIIQNALYSTKAFGELYNYDGELGALYSKEKTDFKVWSPVSKKIVLKLYKNGTPKSVDATKGDDTVYKEIEMVKGDKGVFSTSIEGDLEGTYYTYTVYNKNNLDGIEIVDPYAKGCGINGKRGMIVDFSKTNPDDWEMISPLQYDRKNLVVYETHVQDVTSSSTWGGTPANAKKYSGLIEEGTTLPNDATISTGFDHIKELGVNAVQLLPIYDQDNDENKDVFNWGYNPLNYNCLEGAYSSNPYDGYTRIKEFKEIIKKYNQAGINIIMDVVYNHVMDANASNFNALMPGYYFRTSSGGILTNGSGCGNETASDHYMFRKFMIDSTSFWAKEYKLGGFRFDLMGLHDRETMNQLTAACKLINPSIVIYGEPWTGGTSALEEKNSAKQGYANSYEGYGQFNDQMRDALIKGGMCGISEKGWVTNTTSSSKIEANKIAAGLKGITETTIVSIDDPDKTVNYVTCHDNYTLYDRIKACGIENEDTIRKMAMLANSVVLTSEGTTFMLAGEEMLRTKGGNSNSYNSSYEVNELDYSKLQDSNIKAMFENYKKLISYKTKNTYMAYNKEQIKENMSVECLDNNSTIVYTITLEDKTIKVIHSNGVEGKSQIDLTGYNVYLDTLNNYAKDAKLDMYTPECYSTLIAIK